MFRANFAAFLFYRFYSVFLIIFFRTETLLAPVSDFPDEEKVTVLRMVQSTVKMYVRSKQKHDFDVGINWIVISMLSPSSNRPREKLHFHCRAEDLGQDNPSAGQTCDWALPNTKPKCYILDHRVWYRGLHHFSDVATWYIGHSRIAGIRKLNNGQRCEWNESTNKWLKPLRCKLSRWSRVKCRGLLNSILIGTAMAKARH